MIVVRGWIPIWHNKWTKTKREWENSWRWNLGFHKIIFLWSFSKKKNHFQKLLFLITLLKKNISQKQQNHTEPIAKYEWNRNVKNKCWKNHNVHRKGKHRTWIGAMLWYLFILCAPQYRTTQIPPKKKISLLLLSLNANFVFYS